MSEPVIPEALLDAIYDRRLAYPNHAREILVLAAAWRDENGDPWDPHAVREALEYLCALGEDAFRFQLREAFNSARAALATGTPDRAGTARCYSMIAHHNARAALAVSDTPTLAEPPMIPTRENFIANCEPAEHTEGN